MKKIVLSALALLTFCSAFAQQDPQFTMNMFNKLAVNPAFAGARNSICASVLVREQWMGFEGNPSTNVFNGDGAFTYKEKQFGAGLTLIQDEIGPINSLNVKMSFAYHHRIKQGMLSVGIAPGIFNQSISADWRTSEGNFDGTEDPSIPNSEAGATQFDLGFGLYYYTRDLYVGVSSTHLNQPEINDSPDDNSSYVFNQVRHYYIMAGYNYPVNVGAAEIELQPSLFVKSDAVNTQVDINVNALYNNLFWGGVTYRLEDAVALLAGLYVPKVDGLKVGMAYDYNISDLGDYNDGSLEFLLSYCMPINKKPKLERYKSVRFL